ncbi:hypothetical protein DPX16_20769 [Anabarilius grahami]|uniref:Uncharacterized protein n=1 Tax=Anabarilius grahami TaxID=495550 RepID=A0A3N0ZAI3_ANAGA|nr:hypothetical protein DPX16_20769 [Anabarilius grahami]
MALPAVQLLCLEQGDPSLELHTSDFLQLACQTYFPDRSFCVFYHTGLSERSKARIPAGSPTEDFAAYVEWVLVNNNSPFTICPAEDDTSTTPHPETSHPPPITCTMERREPTADRGVQPAGMNETEPEERTEGVVAPGCEPQATVTETLVPTVMYRGKVLYFELRNRFFYDFKYNNNTQPYQDPAAFMSVSSPAMDLVYQLLHLRQRDLSIEEYVHQFLIPSPEPVHVMAASESVPVFAAIPEPRHVSADLPEPRHASADLPDPRHASTDLPDPHHVSADLPKPSHISVDLIEPSAEIAALAIMATAIWCVWAAHTSAPVPEPAPVHESIPEPAPVHESAPEPASIYESTPESTSVHESIPVFAPVPEPSLMAYDFPVCLDMTTEVVPEFPVCLDTTTEVVPEFPVCLDMTAEVVPELFVCLDATAEVVPELLTFHSEPWRAFLSSLPVYVM